MHRRTHVGLSSNNGEMRGEKAIDDFGMQLSLFSVLALINRTSMKADIGVMIHFFISYNAERNWTK